jgi:3-dehydroquinate dehydratase II
MKKILILNGPNLNLLGSREPAVYGHDTLADIDLRLVNQAKAGNATADCFQTNDEGALINRIHQAKKDGVDFIIINPAAFTHTSVALRDALAGVEIPFIEVHLSNIHAREAFRQVSFVSALAIGVITGLGAAGYQLALTYALAHHPYKKD